MRHMKEHYLLDPEVIFLNHGSFGATPHPVLEAFRNWQARLERQPVQFLGRDIADELKRARQALGDYLHADSDDLVYIPNATYGVNIIARSLKFEPGDEILTTDHEYGACVKAWDFAGQKNGSSVVKRAIPLPLQSPDEVAELFWGGVTPRTKMIFISHLTSPTAVCMPVEIICRKAREAGIWTVIDGAHAPGQLPLDLIAMQPDFYLGNCHKWLQSPKGAGFMYTRRELQPLLDPLVVSWGWGEDATFLTGSKYQDYFEWPGTHDPSAFLSVPAAIQFHAEHRWPEWQERCRMILADGIAQINSLTGLESAYSDRAAPFMQLAVVRLPRLSDNVAFQRELLKKYRIEVPCIEWNGQHFIRISVQAYNTESDLDALVAAVGELLPKHSV